MQEIDDHKINFLKSDVGNDEGPKTPLKVRKWNTKVLVVRNLTIVFIDYLNLVNENY